MSLTISFAFLFIGLSLMLLAVIWQLRHVLSAIRDKWDLRPSLLEGVLLLIGGATMLTIVLLQPFRMLVFTFVYAIAGSLVLAFAFVRLRRNPGIEYTPFWYVGEPHETWKPLHFGFKLPRRTSIEWIAYFLVFLSVSLAVFAAKYRSAARMRLLEEAAINHLQPFGSIREHLLLFENANVRQFPGRAKRSYDVKLAGSSVSDEDLERLRDLNNHEASIRSLNLGATEITNEGLRHIGELTTLTSLTLSGTQIDDAGLRHLSRLKQLRTLALRQTNVTGVAFPVVQQRLEIDLSRCPLSADGLAAIAGTKTTVLYLNETEVDDAAIKEVARFDCHIIDLTNTNVSRTVASEIRGPNQVILGPLRITPQAKR